VRSARFVTTRWSLILTAADLESPDAASALSTLCDTYWQPVYAFIRRRGRPPDDARDLTQAFFARVLEKGYFQDADRSRGRFRNFLLAALQHFLANEYDAAVALKRGGGAPHQSLSFDSADEERRFAVAVAAHTETPERSYERRWALSVLDQTMVRLAARYRDGERRVLFAHLQPFLLGEPASYAALSAETGMTEGALRMAHHRLRKHFAASLREIVAETVEDATAVDEEIRYLMTVVGR